MTKQGLQKQRQIHISKKQSNSGGAEAKFKNTQEYEGPTRHRVGISWPKQEQTYAAVLARTKPTHNGQQQ